ncbi:MAG: SurA N-terminal domain-containing protein [Kiritimatiellae bacterium]|nr:SurA N-terminal domain-containing protein [Kiritimatiellia bacterium]
MKKVLWIAAAVLAAFGVGYWLASRRPAAPADAKPGADALGSNVVAVVNGHVLSQREYAQRGATLLADAKRTEHLAYAPEKEAEALAHYAKQALRTWIAKEVMLYGAISAGVKPTVKDEQTAFGEIARALASRKMTPEQFFKEGPLDEAVKRRDFFDAVMVSCFVRDHVRSKVSATDQDVDARVAELKDLNVKTTKPGQKPRFHTDRPSVRAMLLAEREAIEMRRTFRELFPKAGVRCPAHPEFETAEGVEPPTKDKK